VVRRRVTIGSGANSPDANVANLVVRVQLTARGRQLSRETRGVAVHAQATAAVAGLPGRVSGAVDLRTIAQSFLLTHSVKFATRSARLTPNERRYLTSLVRTLQGVKRIDCIGAARDVRKGSRRTSLARSRAKAVCSYLRVRLPHGVKLAPRAEHAGDRRGTTRHADLLLRY